MSQAEPLHPARQAQLPQLQSPFTQEGQFTVPQQKNCLTIVASPGKGKLTSIATAGGVVVKLPPTPSVSETTSPGVKVGGHTFLTAVGKQMGVFCGIKGPLFAFLQQKK